MYYISRKSGNKNYRFKCHTQKVACPALIPTKVAVATIFLDKRNTETAAYTSFNDFLQVLAQQCRRRVNLQVVSRSLR
jgi:hypothetical protein